MEGVETSLTRLAGGKIRRFSTFPDYVAHLAKLGVFGSVDDLVGKRPDLVREIVFDWYRQGQIACHYAMHLAQTPAASKWLSEIVPADFIPGELDHRIIAAAETCEGLQLIFPGVTTARAAAELLVKLCADGRWSCYEGAWDYDEKGDCIPVALRWNAPDGKYTSWVLGIAPFEPMPFTRRFVEAPFTTLVFRPGPPRPPPRKWDSVLAKDAAHLAHMDDRCGDDVDLRRSLRKNTRRDRKALLIGEYQSVARAQTTFALPESCRPLIAQLLVGKAKATKTKRRKR